MDELIWTGRKPAAVGEDRGLGADVRSVAGKLGCIANLAKRWVTVELTDFDTDPMLLNCLNGTLALLSAGPKRRRNRRGSN
jgi:DNA primase